MEYEDKRKEGGGGGGGGRAVGKGVGIGGDPRPSDPRHEHADITLGSDCWVVHDSKGSRAEASRARDPGSKFLDLIVRHSHEHVRMSAVHLAQH